MGKGLKEVEVEVLVNGQHVKPTGKEAEIITGKPGGFVADFILPPGTLPAAKVEVKAAKPSWKPRPGHPGEGGGGRGRRRRATNSSRRPRTSP